VALSYLPRPDGKVFTQSPEIFVQSGKLPKIPFILGDQEDEGTLFALFQPNLTNTEDIEQYLSTLYFKNATPEQVKALVGTYPDDPAAGSPFNSGGENNWYPQFKRLAALLGDVTFTLTRRVVLNISQSMQPDVPTYSYLSSYDRGTPILGTFHASDLIQVFFGILPNFAASTIQQYYFNFLYNLDPNDNSGGTSAGFRMGDLPNWPKWSEGNNLMHVFADRAEILKDDFRQESFNFLIGNIEALHF
jgi:carboxylesterase type B